MVAELSESLRHSLLKLDLLHCTKVLGYFSMTKSSRASEAGSNLVLRPHERLRREHLTFNGCSGFGLVLFQRF